MQFVHIAPERYCGLSKKPSYCFKSWSSPFRHENLSAADDGNDNDEINSRTSDDVAIEFGTVDGFGSLLYHQNTICSYGQLLKRVKRSILHYNNSNSAVRTWDEPCIIYMLVFNSSKSWLLGYGTRLIRRIISYTAQTNGFLPRNLFLLPFLEEMWVKRTISTDNAVVFASAF